MRWIQNFIIDALIFFKGPNFKIKSISHVDHEGFIRTGRGRHTENTIIEYVYNLKTMWHFGETEWPPTFSSTMKPIKKVTRESGADITSQVLSFAGPRKNEITPLAFVDFTKRWKFRFRSPCGIQFSHEICLEPVHENVIVDTILNQRFRVGPSKI
jgi:hypothetical protein